MASVKASFVLHFSPRVVELGKADKDTIVYQVIVSEKYPRYVNLLPPTARDKLFYAERAELLYADGRIELVKGGKRTKH